MEQPMKAVIVILLITTVMYCYIYHSILHEHYKAFHTSTLHYKKFEITLQQQDIYSIIQSDISTKHTLSTEQSNNHIELKATSNVVKPSIVAPTQSPASEGYIFPYSIFEEQTSGAKNLWQLQILAKQIGMKVVEPFAKDSVFTMYGIAPNFSQSLRFGDYFDKGEWNKMVAKDGGSSLVEWEEFITKAPRRAVILHTLKNKDTQKPLVLAYDEDTTVCNTEEQIAESDMHWIKENFNVIKKVCYLVATSLQHPLSINNFTSLIIDNHDIAPNQVTLIIVGWLGIRVTRVHLLPITLFTTVLRGNWLFPPSKRIMSAYEAYIQQYIGDKKYVGIIFRTHHVLYFSPQRDTFDKQSEYLLQCSKNLSTILNKVRSKWKIFLAYDMGTFGSKNYAVKNYKKLAPLQQQIFLDVFNGSLQVNEREENLMKVANGTTDSGVIAQLEKVIATHADCIILLGPHSTFVRSSSFLYISNHHNEKCIVSICAEKFYDNEQHLISSNDIPSNFIND